MSKTLLYDYFFPTSQDFSTHDKFVRASMSLLFEWRIGYIILIILTTIHYCKIIRRLHKITEQLESLHEKLIDHDQMVYDNLVDVEESLDVKIDTLLNTLKNSNMHSTPTDIVKQPLKDPISSSPKKSQRFIKNKKIGKILIGRVDDKPLNADMRVEMFLKDNQYSEHYIFEHSTMTTITEISTDIHDKYLETLIIKKIYEDDLNFMGIVIMVLNTDNDLIREFCISEEDKSFVFKM
jgi:hypothetical protein